jgi:hypothetical protein
MTGCSARFLILAGLIASLWLRPAPQARAQSGAAFLNPQAFPSLGAFNPATDVVIDTGSGEMTGGVSATGVNATAGGGPVLVFTFSSFTLSPGVTVTIILDDTDAAGVALLSQSAMTINGIITADGGAGSSEQFTAGTGTGSEGGTNAYGGDGGGGGGYGGQGGNGQQDIAGGGTYNPDLTSQLSGGGNGGTGGSPDGQSGGTGGTGGGGIQLGALGVLTVSGTVSANGGNGTMGQLSEQVSCGSGGGGSGGGILIQAADVTLTSGAVLSVNGGEGGEAYVLPLENPNIGGGGGGGGGGRIVIAYAFAVVNSGSLQVSGGNSGWEVAANGVGGSVEFEQDPAIPALPSIAVSTGSSGDIITSWPSSASNFVLQASVVLGAGAVWNTLTNAVLIGNNFVLTNQTRGSAGFFRLESQ